MRLDTAVAEGRKDLPAVVLVHGMGMNKMLWTDPLEAPIAGGLLKLKAIYRTAGQLKTLYHDLVEREYTTIAWSQRRPAQESSLAVEELREVMSTARGTGANGIVLIGASRGGLVARKFLEEDGDEGIRALVTICTPHRGSSMARWASYLAPMASVLSPLVPEGERGKAVTAVSRMLGFLESAGVREMLPDSEFISSLKYEPPRRIYSLSLGGTDPSLFSIGRLSFPELLIRFIPDRVVYEEIRKGFGDGLVTAESARMPGAAEHADFPFNHISILFDEGTRGFILERIEKNLS